MKLNIDPHQYQSQSTHIFPNLSKIDQSTSFVRKNDVIRSIIGQIQVIRTFRGSQTLPTPDPTCYNYTPTISSNFNIEFNI